MVATEKKSLLLDISKYSDFMKLIRVTAWMLRFKNNTNSNEKKTRSYCTVNEIREATLLWIRIVQKELYAKEIKALMSGGPVEKKSPIHQLSPCLENGIVCMNSRLGNARNLPIFAKKPIILCAKHPFTRLIISWYHRIHGHLGVEMICNELRQKYWIIGMKTAVKAAANSCIECNLRNPHKMFPEMAMLPEVRVTRTLKAFTFVGVDYFGPLEVINGRKREKRYGALFTCLIVRAVHMEVAFSLSTDDFLMALTRFMNIRGAPEEIWSDNGTNFHGADNELKKAIKEMDDKKIGAALSTKGIKWHFNPPGAPHMGGVWERLVRSIKRSMEVILKNRTLNDQLLHTVLTEAAGTVNSRPLTAVSNDPNDAEAITPNCFLIGTTGITPLPGSFTDVDLCLRKKWRQAQQLSNHFWRRWQKEYLSSLAVRSKWTSKTPEIQKGDLVFIPDMNELKCTWVKGVVVDLHPGKDGQVRVVDLKTSKGLLQRPVAQLYRVTQNI